MALLGGMFGKKRVVKSFFVNAQGNTQTRGIYTFQIDIESGELFFRKYFQTPTDPTYSFKYGRFVLTTYQNRTGTAADGGICSYTSTADTLALVSRISDNGKTYVHACTNGDDVVANKVFAVDYYNGEIMVGAIRKKKLAKIISTYKLKGSSVHPTRQTLPHPTYVGFTPDHTLYVVDLGTDKIYFFDVSEEGQLEQKDTLILPAGSGPNKMIFNPAGNIAYVVNEIASTIMVYTYKEGTFTLIQTIDTYQKEDYPEVENTATNFILNTDGTFAFVSNRGHDTITSFIVGKDGTLTHSDFIDTSFGPVDMCIFNNRWIVVACKTAGNIEVVEYVPEKRGLLFETEYSYLVNEPVCLTTFKDITTREEE